MEIPNFGRHVYARKISNTLQAVLANLVASTFEIGSEPFGLNCDLKSHQTSNSILKSKIFIWSPCVRKETLQMTFQADLANLLGINWFRTILINRYVNVPASSNLLG